MRICIVSDFFVPHYQGGGERRYYELLKRLAAKGHKIDLISMRIRNAEDYEYIDGINVYHLGPLINDPPQRTASDFIKFMTSVSFWLLGHDYDIIEANTWIPMIPVSLVGRLKKARLVTVIHDISSGKSDQWFSPSGSAELIEKILIRLPFDNIICVSNAVKNRLVKKFGISKDKITVIYDGVDIKLIDSIKISKKEKNTLVFVGRLIPHKHVNELIQAIKIIKREIPDIKLKIIGGGQEFDRLSSQIIENKLEKKVELMGVIPDYKDMIKEIKKSQLLVLPSTREGFGIVLAEAFACNIPCIAYYSDGVVEVIDDGVNGYLIKQHDIKSMAKKIKLLLLNKKKRELFAKAGREKTEKNFNWNQLSEQIERFYLSLSRRR